MKLRTLFFFLLICKSFSFTFGQDLIQIGFVVDDVDDVFTQNIKKEIDVLLSDDYDIKYQIVPVDEINNTSKVADFYKDKAIVISSGVKSSFLISSLKDYSKPTIISFVFDHDIQKIPVPDNGTSQIKNLTYVESPFDLRRDFKTLHDIIPYDKLAIVGDGSIPENWQGINTFLSSLAPTGTEVTLFSIKENNESLLEKLSEFKAVYFFPVNESAHDEQLRNLYHSLTDNGIVTFSLVSQPAIDQGAYGAYESDENMNRMPRRVALHSMKILEGQKAEDLKVTMDSYIEDLIINMAAVSHSGIYPDYELLTDASMYNLSNQAYDHDMLSLEKALSEALTNNLQISVAKKEINLSQKDISIAKSNLLPQIDATASAYNLDDFTTRFQGMGTLGKLNLNAVGNFSQVVFSEPVLANIAIQKLLNESNKYALETSQLDIIQNVVNAYIGILQAKALVKLNNDNLNVTRRNYNISKVKQSVGQSGATDVYRWESQQSLQNVEVNNALAQLQQARQTLNFLLNRPTDEWHEIEDFDDSSISEIVYDDRITGMINNEAELKRMSDFFVQEAMANLPEPKQIEASIKALERSLKSQNRAFYLPQFAISGNVTQPLGHFDVPEGVTKVDNPPRTHQVALGLQIPIFQGLSRKHQVERSKIEILQTKDNQELLKDNLELNVRNNLGFLGASYQNLELTAKAESAAEKNFTIVQNSYKEGLINITSLIDAQNALLQAKINATIARYTFISDFIALERSHGQYYFLMSPSEKDSFFNRFTDFITSGNN